MSVKIKEMTDRRRELVMRFLRDGDSFWVACKRAGLVWKTSRQYLMEDHNFRTLYYMIVEANKKKRGISKCS